MSLFTRPADLIADKVSSPAIFGIFRVGGRYRFVPSESGNFSHVREDTSFQGYYGLADLSSVNTRVEANLNDPTKKKASGLVRVPDGLGGFKLLASSTSTISDLSQAPVNQYQGARTMIVHDNALLVLDSTEFVDHIYASKVAKHAIEGAGATTSDHQFLDNTRITLRGYVSDAVNPNDVDSDQRLVDLNRRRENEGEDALKLSIHRPNEQGAREYLQNLRDTASLVTVHTMYGIHRNMLLTAYNFPRFGGTNVHNGLTVQLTFEEQHFTVTKTQDAILSAEATSKKSNDKSLDTGVRQRGSQAPKTTQDEGGLSENAQVSQAILKQIKARVSALLGIGKDSGAPSSKTSQTAKTTKSNQTSLCPDLDPVKPTTPDVEQGFPRDGLATDQQIRDFEIYSGLTSGQHSFENVSSKNAQLIIESLKALDLEGLDLGTITSEAL